MTYTLILRGVYGPDGKALVVVGQPAVLILALTMPNPGGSGPDVPQDLTGRAFTQQVLSGSDAILAEVAGMNLADGQINFTLGSEVIAGLLTGGASAIDLTYQVAEIVTDGLDTILLDSFSVRAPTTGVPTASFTLNTEAAEPAPLIVRYAGAPGAPVSITAPASQALPAGSLVTITTVDVVAVASLASAAAPGARAKGFVVAAVAEGGTATVLLTGLDSVLTGLTPGADYYLSPTTPGGITTIEPTTVGQVAQLVGFAASAACLVFAPGPAVDL